MSPDLEQLKQKIRKIKTPSNSSNARYFETKGLTICLELVAGVLVGLFLGFFLDKLFDSKPICIIICLILSIIATCKTLWQKLNKHDGT